MMSNIAGAFKIISAFLFKMSKRELQAEYKIVVDCTVVKTSWARRHIDIASFAQSTIFVLPNASLVFQQSVRRSQLDSVPVFHTRNTSAKVIQVVLEELTFFWEKHMLSYF